MTRDERLQLAARLGREFHARAMKLHLPPLRRYYADLRAGREPQGWRDDLVTDWATAFRLPPFEHAIEVRPLSSGCGCNARHDSQRPMVFPGSPGGWLVRCLVCGRRWLELQSRSERPVRM